ncbi:hypothetical protein GOBAR_DD04939 [Gossypium barbadense]|nr:hypothetical protein GOBAR_DD04939 [Gossypium barbadense]
MSKEAVNFNMSDLGDALNEEARAGLVNALKNKLQNLAREHTDMLESLSPNVRKRVERYDIVNGVAEAEGTTNDAAMDQKEDNAAEEKGVPDFWLTLYAEKGVPDFWLTAMKNNDVLSDEITERDEGALKYLKDIKWHRIEEPKGFKLEFYFDPNPYFKNTLLTKTYHMIDEDEPILEKAIGTEIEWYPGKCLTQKILKKKPKKGLKNAKPITKTENCESFFNFFNPPEVPDDDEDIDEDTAEELQNQMEQDYDIGCILFSAFLSLNPHLHKRRVEEHKGMGSKVRGRQIASSNRALIAALEDAWQC